MEHLNPWFNVSLKRIEVRSLFFIILYVDGNDEDLTLVNSLDLPAILLAGLILDSSLVVLVCPPMEDLIPDSMGEPFILQEKASR